MPANHAVIEQKYGNIKTVTSLEDRVAVDVDDIDGGEPNRVTEGVELSQHLVAKVAVLAMDEREACRV